MDDPLRRSPMGVRGLVEHVNGTWQCFSWSELAAMSSEHAVRRALAARDIVRLAPGAYCGSMHSDSFAARSSAVRLWLGDRAAMSGAAALFDAGIMDDPPQRLQVTVPAHASVAARPWWLEVRHASYPLAVDLRGGGRVVQPAMALCQAFGSLPPVHRDGLVLRALQLRRVRAADVRSVLERMPRVRDRRVLERLITAFEQGAESVLEMRALDQVFTGREWERLTRQHAVRARGGRFQLDMYDAKTRTAIECDGESFHARPDRWQRDRNRDAELAAMGILVLRFTSHDLSTAPDWCRDIARRTLERRSRSQLAKADIPRTVG